MFFGRVAAVGVKDENNGSNAKLKWDFPFGKGRFLFQVYHGTSLC